MPGESLANKIPDLYFDWYARFLPGFFAVAYYFTLPGNDANFSANSLILYAAISYASGHAIQPVSSFIVKILEKDSNVSNLTYIEAKRNGGNVSLLGKVR